MENGNNSFGARPENGISPMLDCHFVLQNGDRDAFGIAATEEVTLTVPSEQWPRRLVQPGRVLRAEVWLRCQAGEIPSLRQVFPPPRA